MIMMKKTNVFLFATTAIFASTSTVAFQAPLPGRNRNDGNVSRLQQQEQSRQSRRNSFLRMSINFDDIEMQAQEASENWSISTTPFLNEADAKTLDERLEKRADVGYVRVGGLPAFSRSRFVLSNPDLGLDSATAEEEHCVVLCVDNISLAHAWPTVLMRIGVDLENVGDVVVEGGTAYLVVTPEVAKQCSRLLPKELKEAGVTVSALDPGEYLPYDGELQNMELGKLEKRALKYKNK